MNFNVIIVYFYIKLTYFNVIIGVFDNKIDELYIKIAFFAMKIVYFDIKNTNFYTKIDVFYV